MKRVAVVGGGIVGASAAYHLARRGADVTLLERAQVAAGATGKSFAWINASFDKQPRSYFQLCWLGVLSYARLQVELEGDLPIQWGGSVAWAPDAEGARGLEQAVRRHQSWGYPTRLIDREELRALEPNLEPGALRTAMFSEQEASIDPAAAAAVLLRAAERYGARVIAPCEVIEFESRGGRIVGVKTSRGGIPADVVVLAAGVASPRLAARVGLCVPLVESPGVLAHVSPVAPRIARVILGPEIHVKQMRDGRVVIGEHGRGFRSADGSREHGERLLAAAAALIPDLAGARLEGVTVADRPVPSDEYPIVGFAGKTSQIYLMVTHSGVTLAAILGRIASQEILDGVRVELFEPYRPERFS